VLDTVQHPLRSICQNVEDPACVDAHIADAAEPMLEKMLFADRATNSQGETDQHLSGKSADPDDPLGRIRFDRRP
jgi:hypothetical protein